MIKMTDFYMLCKWENLKNQQCIKYMFSPLYISPNISRKSLLRDLNCAD